MVRKYLGNTTLKSFCRAAQSRNSHRLVGAERHRCMNLEFVQSAISSNVRLNNCRNRSEKKSAIHTIGGANVGRWEAALTQLFCRFSRGIDDRDVMEESEVKSFSSEASYGIRTKSTIEAYMFVEEIAQKALENMLRAGYSARRIHVKVYRTKVEGGGEHSTSTGKIKGHGPCTIHTASHIFHAPTQDKALFFSACRKLYDKLATEHKITPAYNRGFGVQMDSLQSSFAAKSQPTIKAAFNKLGTDRMTTTQTPAQRCCESPKMRLQPQSTRGNGKNPRINQRTYCQVCTFTHAAVMCNDCTLVLCAECDQEQHLSHPDHTRPNLCGVCFVEAAVHLLENTTDVCFVCGDCLLARGTKAPTARTEPTSTLPPPKKVHSASTSAPMYASRASFEHRNEILPSKTAIGYSESDNVALLQHIKDWLVAVWVDGPEDSVIDELCGMLVDLVTQTLQVDVALTILRSLRRNIVRLVLSSQSECNTRWVESFNSTILPFVQCYVESIHAATLDVRPIVIN
eukprot:m.99308 g.99308  ORF g.99308 m.99308 type:complete len:514 (+) comp12455_c0_seq1:1516-3057(+)